jgi:hypothetical protein
MTNSNSQYEEFNVTSNNLVGRVRELLHEGNVRRLVVKRESGESIIEVPLTAGVAVTTAGAVVAPALVVIGALAALFTQVTIGVERRAESKIPA